MIRDLFWLTDAQFARLEPLLPTDTTHGASLGSMIVE